MALNLWQVAGQPNSFSVGTTQINFPVPLRNNTPYRIRLKITSDTQKSFTFNPWGEEKILACNYPFSFNVITIPSGTFELVVDYEVLSYNVNMAFMVNSGSVQVEVLELVHKPLPAPKRTLPSKRQLKAKTGLAFNGVSDYFTTNDITADEIEFELSANNLTKIQALSHPNANEGGSASNLNGYIDAQGKPYFFTTNTDGTRTDLRTVIPLSLGVRTRIKFSVKNGRKLFINDEVVASDNKAVVDNVFRFGRMSEAAGMRFHGTLYKVTCYLSGNIVAQYDFENPSTLIGDKVIPNAKNLIPSFEDSRWNYPNSNVKIFGKDVLQINPPHAWEINKIVFNLPVGGKYLATVDGDRSLSIDSYNASNVKSVLNSATGSKSPTFTVPNESVRIEVICTSEKAGTFTFIKPQLHELPGKEATIYGKPVPLRRTAKRLLYAKR